jgi:hypothetical protein
MKFKKIPPIESVVQPKKVLCSPSKVPLIIDRIVTKLTELQLVSGECEVCSFRYTSLTEGEMQPKRYFVFQANYP